MKTLRERNYIPEGDDWGWFKQFCGIEMSSNYYVFHIFSTILTKNPQITRIVELGTYTGSMSIYLGLEGIRNGIKVTTFDIKDHLTPPTKELLKRLGVNCIIQDIFADMDSVKGWLSNPVYLLCDNGNKKQEFAQLVPHLKSGSVVSVHDYGVEFMEEDTIYPDLLEPFHPEDWQKHNVQLATWIVK